jgi:hypothetical protein
LASMGYEFNSTQSANDVLTGFPYYVYDRKSFSGNPSTVLEIPMLISDVFKDDPIVDTNHLLKVNIWIRDIARYSANNAPVTLLIHPNRQFKLDSEQRLLDSLPFNMIPYPFQQYGEYWRKRDSLLFHTDLSNDTLYVRMDNNKLDMRQSFIIDYAGLDTVRFFDYNGAELTFQHQVYNATQRLYYRQQLVTQVNKQPENSSFNVYPNPTTGLITVLGDKIEPGSILTVHDITGKLVYSTTMQNGYKQVDLGQFAHSAGMYFVKVQGNRTNAVKKVVLEQR